MAYSVWAQPTGPLLDQLQVIINEMADKHNTPRFVPHVTVAGPIENKSGEEILKICSELGTTLPAYKLRLNRVGKANTRFQCVFILMHKDEEAVSAAVATQRAFGLASASEPYMPHLSLLYADISEEERTELAEQLQELLSLSEEGAPALLSESFAVDSLAVWRTPLDGPPEEWAQVAEVPLKGGAEASAGS